MTSDLREKLKEIIKDCDHMHSEKCGNNYYGVKGFSCRCGRGRCMDDDVDVILKLFETELAQAVKEEKEKAKSWLLYCPNCKQTLEGIEIRRPEEKEWEATPGKVELTERRKLKSEYEKKKEEEK